MPEGADSLSTGWGRVCIALLPMSRVGVAVRGLIVGIIVVVAAVFLGLDMVVLVIKSCGLDWIGIGMDKIELGWVGLGWVG